MSQAQEETDMKSVETELLAMRPRSIVLTRRSTNGRKSSSTTHNRTRNSKSIKPNSNSPQRQIGTSTTLTVANSSKSINLPRGQGRGTSTRRSNVSKTENISSFLEELEKSSILSNETVDKMSKSNDILEKLFYFTLDKKNSNNKKSVEFKEIKKRLETLLIILLEPIKGNIGELKLIQNRRNIPPTNKNHISSKFLKNFQYRLILIKLILKNLDHLR